MQQRRESRRLPSAMGVIREHLTTSKNDFNDKSSNKEREVEDL